MLRTTLPSSPRLQGWRVLYHILHTLLPRRQLSFHSHDHFSHLLPYLPAFVLFSEPDHQLGSGLDQCLISQIKARCAGRRERACGRGSRGRRRLVDCEELSELRDSQRTDGVSRAENCAEAGQGRRGSTDDGVEGVLGECRREGREEQRLVETG